MIKNIILLLLILSSTRSYSQWIVLQSQSTDLNSISFVSSLTGYAAGNSGAILKTTNGGANWNSLSSGISVNINSIHFLNVTNGAACGNSGNIIITTNSGATWSSVNSGVTVNLNSISFQNNYGVCAGSSGTLLYSTNGGLNWATGVTGFLTTYYGGYTLSSTIAFACGVNTIFQPFVAKTTNGGVNWNYTAFYLISNEGTLRNIHFISESEGFAVSHVFNGQGGISRTTNGGSNWTTQLFANFLYDVDFSGQNTGYAVGTGGLILKTTNGGTDWINQTNPVSSELRAVDFVDSLLGYAAGSGGVILKTTNGGLTFINNPGNYIPYNFELVQNYPNPFNPSTLIKYTVANAGRVKLKIYDVHGKEVAMLVNKNLSIGSYIAEFDGSGFGSGIYIYSLVVNGKILDSKKMILLK